MFSEDDQDVFEITDFTTVSDWERFIGQIEEVIHEWKLPSTPKKPELKKNEIDSGVWETTTETLNFVNFNFVITRHTFKHEEEEDTTAPQDEDEENESLPLAMTDMMCTDYDFLHKGHCLSQWFGLRDFVIIRAIFEEGISTETRSKLLLSSATVAINNTNCQIPMFVQIHPKTEDYFLGVCEGANIRTNFEMVYTRRTPQKYGHLSGLMDVFRSKIGIPGNLSTPNTTVSIKFTYTLDDWSSHTWPQSPPDMDLFMGEVGVSRLGELPHGAFEDPVSQLLLHTVWPSLLENLVSDNAVFSDLDPIHAQEWTAKLTLKPNLQCLLFEYLSDFKTLCTRKETSAAILGHEIEEPDPIQNAKITKALDKLTEPVNIPSISSVVSRARTRVQTNQDKTPIPTDLLIKILQFIFPDAASADMNKHSENLFTGYCEENTLGNIKDQLKTLKSAPMMSLATRLALAMCHVNHSYGGLNGVAHLWQEFVLEMRYRWENHYTLPCMESGMPNFRYSILHQKLQMLNCCIIRKKTREEQASKSESTSPTTSQASVDSASISGSETDYEDDDLIFYECSDDVSDKGSQAKKIDTDSKGDSCETSSLYRDTFPTLPEGRLRKCGDMKLKDSNCPIYIPVTQEPAPMTEDLLEEHAKILVQLGTDQEGTQLRAKMQSTCLTSDMEAFKAANPNAVLEDFVRWYSPRDYIEEEVIDEFTGKTYTKGHLSARMLIPGNMWSDVWENAKPVPARRQKRLFDDTKEAEKVLHFLSSSTPAQVAHHLFPMLIHSSLITIMKHCDEKFRSLVSLLELTVNKAIKVTRSPAPDIGMYEKLIKMIGTAETFIARVQSVKTKFLNKDLEKIFNDASTTEQMDTDSTDPQSDLNVSNEPDDSEEINSFVYEILKGSEVNVTGTWQSPVGKAITKLFTDAYEAANMISEDTAQKENSRYSQTDAAQKFPSPTQREYIIRTVAARPAAYSNPTPQRMHCIINDDSFRIAGAFSEDTLFQ